MEDLNQPDNENSGPAKRWLDEIHKAESRLKKYFDRCKEITKRYRDEREQYTGNYRNRSSQRFNILWSNTQTILPMLYSRMPKPVIERRFKDNDRVSRVASEMWEKATSTMIDLNGFNEAMKNSTLEYALYAQGCSWVRYKPTVQDVEIAIMPGQPPMVEQQIVYEEAIADFVRYEDFLYSDSRTWEEVDWVARRVFMSRKEGLERFGDVFKKVQLDQKQSTADTRLSNDSAYNKAIVYEIWCKPENKVFWVAKSYGQELLDEMEPPIKFDGFFPCPKPAFGTFATNKIEPVPDFMQYQDQAYELDQTTNRIGQLIKSIKAVGLYDGAFSAFGELLREGVDNQLFPVTNDWDEFVKGGGTRGMQNTIAMLPIDSSVQAMQALYQAREQTKQTIYEITGISDIIRGASNPDETATAQEIKGRFGTMRLQDKQAEIQRFARDNIRLVAEVIAEQFSPDTLIKMSGMKLPTRQDVEIKYQQEVAKFQQDMMQYQQVAMQAQQMGQQPPPPPEQPTPPEVVTIDDVMELLQDDPIRNFKIDIETDSTIATDYEAEKQSRVEFISNVAPFLQQMIPAVQAMPQLAEPLGEMLMFVVRGFKAGRQLESSFEESFKKLQEERAQPPSPPPPDPMIELKKQQVEGDLQLKREKIQGDLALQQEKLKSDILFNQKRNLIAEALSGYQQ